MGLFDFVKEIGHKLFNRDAEAAEKIKQHIEATYVFRGSPKSMRHQGLCFGTSR